MDVCAICLGELDGEEVDVTSDALSLKCIHRNRFHTNCLWLQIITNAKDNGCYYEHCFPVFDCVTVLCPLCRSENIVFIHTVL